MLQELTPFFQDVVIHRIVKRSPCIVHPAGILHILVKIPPFDVFAAFDGLNFGAPVGLFADGSRSHKFHTLNAPVADDPLGKHE